MKPKKFRKEVNKLISEINEEDFPAEKVRDDLEVTLEEVKKLAEDQEYLNGVETCAECGREITPEQRTSHMESRPGAGRGETVADGYRCQSCGYEMKY